MLRTELIDTLRRVEPALGVKDFLPALLCFCFDGEYVLAYDDVIALEAPCKLPLTGGLRGKLLLDYLGKSRAEVAEFEEGGAGEVTLRLGKAGSAGGGRLKLPLLGAEEFVFAFPAETAGAAALPAGKELTDALALSALGMSEDAATPWMLGVTAAFGTKNIVLYSSDNKTATRVSVRRAGAFRPPVLFPPQFVTRLASAGRGDPVTELLAHDDWLIATFESGVRLFGRTVKGATLDNYAELFKQSDAVAAHAVPVPAALGRAVERAAVVAGFSADPFTEFALAGDRLTLHTAAPAADATEVLKLPGLPADILVRAAPGLLLRALPFAQGIAFAPDFILLVGDGFTHMISTVQIGEGA